MPNPDLIPEPFAQSGDKNTIPLERAIADPVYRASWKAGFPPDTRLPKDVGGEAPDGLDFNGILNVLSQAIVFMQKGNAYQFDASLAPYPIGAIVRSNDDLTTFQSTIALNSNNPNSNMTGWRVYNGSGFIVDNLTTNDSAKALSAAQGKVLQDNKLEANKVAAANGVASLDSNTRVPVSQLPAATISDAGVLRFATAAEVANKTNVSAAITPANVGQTFGQSLSQDGWCRLPNGLIMQWGKTTGVVGNVNFSQAFNSVFFVTASPIHDENISDGQASQTKIKSFNNTSFSYSSGVESGGNDVFNPASLDFTWFAIGY